MKILVPKMYANGKKSVGILKLLTFSVFSDENFFGFFPLPFVDKLLISKHSSSEILVLEAIFAFVEMSHAQISICSTAWDFVANLIMYPKPKIQELSRPRPGPKLKPIPEPG